MKFLYFLSFLIIFLLKYHSTTKTKNNGFIKGNILQMIINPNYNTNNNKNLSFLQTRIRIRNRNKNKARISTEEDENLYWPSFNLDSLKSKITNKKINVQRKTADGRKCAKEFIYKKIKYTDCINLEDPDGKKDG